MANGEWPKVKLADVAEQCLGKMLDAKKNKGRQFPYLRNPNVRWFDVDTTDLQTMRFEDHEHERYGLRAGDIVICEGGEAGRAAIWDGRLPDLKFQKAIHRVRPGPKLYNRFFVHRLMADHQSGRLADYFTGATIKHFTGQDLARYEFPLPPLAEQQRIAEVLDRAEALRAKRRAALTQLDSLTQSLFLDLFGDPITNRKGFPISQMGDVCDVRDGTHNSPEYVSDNRYPLVTSKNLSGGTLDLTDVNYISEADYVQINKRSKVDRGDIIIPMIGTIGSPVLIDHEPQFAIKNVALIKFTDSSPAAVFVCHLLSCYYFDHIISQKNRGGTQKFVSLGDLRSFPLPVPPVELQYEFARCLAAVEKLKTVYRTSLAEMGALFASLQYRAFSGELFD